MKVTTSTPEKVFAPIVLTITIESKEELNDMYSRFNNCQNETSGHDLINRKVPDNTTEKVFSCLDRIIRGRCAKP